jgi:hypothetical protein
MTMHRLLIAGGLLLSAALIAPIAVQADDRNHQDNRRYYDRSGKDYHQWNGQEDKAFRVYLGEQHRDYRDFHRENRGQQQQYFTWRHSHPDSTIFKVEIR